MTTNNGNKNQKVASNKYYHNIFQFMHKQHMENATPNVMDAE